MKRERKQNRGFTLTELMTVVAIIGILVTVAVPMYKHYILESQRSDIQGELLQMITLQERFYVNNFAYTTNLTQLGYPTDPMIFTYNRVDAYRVNAVLCNIGSIYPDNPDISRCVRLIATPLNDQVNDGGLILDSRGRKVLDYASIAPRDWVGNDLGTTPALSQAACPECASFPDAL